MASRGRLEVNVDVDDFFDVPVRSPHKTTTFTMSTKSNADDRSSAGDFQPPCASDRKDRSERPDTDRGEILTLTMSSDSGSDVETRGNKNSARSSNRSQRSAKTTPVSGSRARKVKRNSSNYSSVSDTDSDSDSGTDSDSDSGSNATGTSVPSPRKSSEIKCETRIRDTRSMGDDTDSHKQAWNGNGRDGSQNAIERPKTALRRRVNGQGENGRLQPRVRDGRNRSRSRSNDSRGRSRSHSSRSSSSCSSLTSSDSNASDVTDVSPLVSPTHKVSTADMHRWERCQLGEKPPRSPANKGGSSQRSHPDSATSATSNGRENLNLLQSTSDKMDLKILMQAVLEMEREKDRPSSTDHHVFFQPGGLKNTTHSHLDSRQNFSFTNDKVRDIDTENQRLMHQILKYTAKKKVDQRSETSQAGGDALVVTKKRQTSAGVTHLTASAINRMREQRRIERDNQALLKRLQKTRPTRTLRRDNLLEDYNKQLLAGLSIAAYHPPLKATHAKHRPGSSTASVYTNSVTSLRSEFGGSTASNVGSRRPQSATLVTSTRQAPEKRRRPLSATTRPVTGTPPGKVRPLSASMSRNVARQRPLNAAWEPGW